MNVHLADLYYKGFWTVLDWVYPPECAGCGESGYRLCLSCQEKIQLLTGNCCIRCGESLSPRTELCESCQTNPPVYSSMRNYAKYEGVIRECIHALKYENNQSLGELFSRWLMAIVGDAGWKIDVVMPVPLSLQREKERGYNQSALIAHPLARRLKLQYTPFGLLRTRDTVSQVGLSADDRHRNVVGAFLARPEIAAGKNILLVDDVMTTGSTMSACTNALMSAGTKAVYCITVARFSMRNAPADSSFHQV